MPIHYEPDEPSIVVDVAFGNQHDEAIERERQRTREVIEGLSESARSRSRPKPSTKSSLEDRAAIGALHLQTGLA